MKKLLKWIGAAVLIYFGAARDESKKSPGRQKAL